MTGAGAPGKRLIETRREFWIVLIWSGLSLLFVILAAAATIHLLLTYRRPETAVAWIFALWVVPLLGFLLYLAFGVYGNPDKLRGRRGRVMRAVRLSRGSRPESVTEELGAPYTRIVDGATPFPALPGHEVEVIRDGAAAFEQMFEAIAGGRRLICITTYIMRSDAIGDRLLEGLAQACKRGVLVRMLVDSVGSWGFQTSGERRFQEAGVATARCHAPAPWRGRFQVNSRNHRKLLLVDDVVFTGGRNWGAEYLGQLEGDLQDLTFRLAGPSVAFMSRIFEEDWAIATGEPVREACPPPAPAGDHIVRVIPGGPDEPQENLVTAFGAALRSARESIFVVTPYLVPGRAMIQSLCLAARAGVRVQVVLPRESDSRLVDYASRRDFERLLDAGVEILEAPTAFVHAKALIIDGALSMVGSANFDWRSLHLNQELNITVCGTAFARELREAVGSILERAVAVDPASWRGRGLLQRVAENTAALFGPLL